jgi:2-(acetamidomethylene)succinate hydrolase
MTHISVHTQNFPTDTVQLHGAKMGEGPLVVYLHGITANWAVWTPILETMSDRSTGVAVSQRGHGLSEKPATGYRGLDFSADVIALIESLDQGPAIIVGHSLGARNAVLAGHQRPDLVSGVLSIDFVPHTGRKELQTLADRVGGGDRDFADLEEVRTYLKGRYKLMPDDAVDRRAVYGYDESGHQTLRPLADPEAMRQTAIGLFEPYPEPYRHLAVPMIAMRGQLSTLVSQEAFADAASLRPDVDHVVIEGVDHYIPEEQPDVVVANIRRLLDWRQDTSNHICIGTKGNHS